MINCLTQKSARVTEYKSGLINKEGYFGGIYDFCWLIIFDMYMYENLGVSQNQDG